MKSAQTTSRYSQLLAPLVRPFPDFDVPFISPFRRNAIRRLALRPGDRVLDVGCGSGGSFRYLLDAVGPQGEVVGIELSPTIAALAKRRVEKNNWRNAAVIEAPAQTARLDGKFDAAIMFGANELFTSKEVLDNVFAHLKYDARVVVMGAKLVEGGALKGFNPLYRMMTSKLMLPSTPALNSKPFELLQHRMREFQIEELAGGFLFLVWGTIKSPAGTRTKP
jgi:demethylmenaquinone methyltransferase/2-methoxy-6-polyprenyl-1,4-benzoquinol methylase